MILNHHDKKKHYCLSEYYIDKENARWHMWLWFSIKDPYVFIQKT